MAAAWHSVRALREQARATLPRAIFEYADGGAEKEWTLRRNEAAFDDVAFLPRPLRGAPERNQSVTLLGARLTTPVILGPTGLSGLFWPDGELCAARAAARQGTVYCLSHGSVCRLEALADVKGPPRWMQIFIYRDREFGHELARRAQEAGYAGLVLTIDNQVTGNRERDLRNGFSIPPRFGIANSMKDGLQDQLALAHAPRITSHHVRQLCPPQRTSRHCGHRRQVGSIARSIDVLAGCGRAARCMERAADPEGSHPSRGRPTIHRTRRGRDHSFEITEDVSLTEPRARSMSCLISSERRRVEFLSFSMAVSAEAATF